MAIGMLAAIRFFQTRTVYVSLPLIALLASLLVGMTPSAAAVLVLAPLP